MLLKLLLALLLCNPETPPVEQIYTAWTDTGYHLCISDSGTPDDPEDDYIVDWEDDRDFEIVILDGGK